MCTCVPGGQPSVMLSLHGRMMKVVDILDPHSLPHTGALVGTGTQASSAPTSAVGGHIRAAFLHEASQHG